MTQPGNPDEGKQQPPKDTGKPAGKPAPVGPLELVVFERHDPILGRPHRGVGVVVDVDDQGATVRPLAHHDVRVALADVQRYDDAADSVTDPTA